MKIRLLENKKVEIEIRDHKVISDQTLRGGGDDTAPTPTEYMIASLGACIAVYAINYAESRNVPLEDVTVDVETEVAKNPTRISKFDITVTIPPSFPEEHHERLMRVMHMCMVHKTMQIPPEVNIDLKVSEPDSSEEEPPRLAEAADK
jgi:uncharacterized OsmC-like protein